MSHLIDLMPASSRARLRGRSATRRWWVAYAGIAGVAALATGAFRLRAMHDARTRDRLILEVALDEDFQREIAEIEAQGAASREAIIRHARIAWPVELSDVIGVIAEVVPEPVTLTSIAVTPRLEPERPGDKSGLPPAPLALTVELAGVAPTDLEVASLIAGLEDSRLFSRVAMDHARQTVGAGAVAREFGLTCEIDLVSRRRKGAGPPPAEAPK